MRNNNQKENKKNDSRPLPSDKLKNRPGARGTGAAVCDVGLTDYFTMGSPSPSGS